MIQYGDKRLSERFWSKVDTLSEHGCWIYSRSALTAYPRCVSEKSVKPNGAHRVAYELLVGPVPDGWVVDHLCGRSKCVNPQHLEAVEVRVNVKRGVNGWWTDDRNVGKPVIWQKRHKDAVANPWY